MSLLEKENQSESILEGFKHYVYFFQILEFRSKTTLGQPLEYLSVDQVRIRLVSSGLQRGNFLDRNFSELPLLYETKHETFEDNNKKKVVVVVVVSVGRLGETWVG